MKCTKNKKGKNPMFVNTNSGRMILASICAVCDSKNLGFITEKEASWLLSSLGIKILVSKLSLSANNLF